MIENSKRECRLEERDRKGGREPSSFNRDLLKRNR